MEYNISLNVIKKFIENYTKNHPTINSFYYGDLQSITDTKDPHQYTLFGVIPVRVTYPLNEQKDILVKRYELQILIMDKLDGDFENQDDILSDTQQIGEDFISYLLFNISNLYGIINIHSDINFTYFFEKGTDMVAGVSFPLIIESSFNGCLNPVLVDINDICL